MRVRRFVVGAVGALLAVGGANVAGGAASADEESAELPPGVVQLEAATLTVPSWVSGGTVPVPAWSCPDDHPYLWDRLTDPSGSVPWGVFFTGSGAVKIKGVVHTTDGRAAGWAAGGIASGIKFYDPGTVTVGAYCTSDPDEAYFTTPPAAPELPRTAQAYFLDDGVRSYTVTAGGFPAPALRIVTGALPQGLTFTDNGDGTATIAGRPFGIANSTSILIEAKNHYGQCLQTLNIYW